MFFGLVGCNESRDHELLLFVLEISLKLHKRQEFLLRHQYATVNGGKLFFSSNIELASDVLAGSFTLDTSLSALIDDLSTELQIVVSSIDLSVLAHFNHTGVKVGVGQDCFEENLWEFLNEVWFKNIIFSIILFLDVVDNGLSWLGLETVAFFYDFGIVILPLLLLFEKFININQKTGVRDSREIKILIFNILLCDVVCFKLVDLLPDNVIFK